MPIPISSPRLTFDIPAAARLIGSSDRWLADQLRAGRFPGRKVGRRWMLTRDDLDEILRLCAVVPTAAHTSDADIAARPGTSMTRTTARRLRRADQLMPADDEDFEDDED
jgi:Helix-turn-helix domain